MQRRVLELLARTEDDLTDAELMGRACDDLWYLDLCLDTLHRLPGEIDPILPCSLYTTLKARSIVRQAMDDMVRRWRTPQGG